MRKSGERHSYREADYLKSVHRQILQAWVDGLESTSEVAATLGKANSVVKKLQSEITSMMNEGLGSNSRAKAVRYAVTYGLVNFNRVDEIKPIRDFSDREKNVFTWICVGFNDREIAKQLGIEQTHVRQERKDILENLGISSTLMAVAWAVRKTIQMHQKKS